MGSGRIKRYICREILGPSGIALVVFTAILFLGRLLRMVDLVIDRGVPAGAVLRLFVSLLPHFLVYTIPLSLLVGTIIGFSRLSNDREVIAFQSAGVGLLTLAAPPLILSLPICIVVAIFTLWAAPAGNASVREQLFRIAANRASVAIQPGRFVNSFPGLVIYAQHVDGRTGDLEHVLVADERPGQAGAVIVAERGRLAIDPVKNLLALRLENGTIHPETAAMVSRNYRTMAFDQYQLRLSLGIAQPDPFSNLKPRESTTRDLFSTPYRISRRSDRQHLAELHRRLALPFAPALFSLIGVPLGIRQQRSGRSGGFAMGIAVFLIYFSGLSLADILTVEAAIPPAWTFWPLQLLFFVAGTVVYRRQGANP